MNQRIPVLPPLRGADSSSWDRAVYEMLRVMLQLPFFKTGSFSVVEGVVVPASTFDVKHGLGRKPVGLLLLNTDAAIRAPAILASTDLIVTLSSTNAATADIMFW